MNSKKSKDLMPSAIRKKFSKESLRQKEEMKALNFSSQSTENIDTNKEKGCAEFHIENSEGSRNFRILKFRNSEGPKSLGIPHNPDKELEIGYFAYLNHVLGFFQNRRDKEKQVVGELSELLPLSAPIRDQLDKSGVIRIVIAHVQLRRLFSESLHTDFNRLNLLIRLFSTGKNRASNFIAEHQDEKSQNRAEEPLKMFAFNAFQTMSGFIIILDWSGKIVYVTETASVHLGLSQVDMVGTLVSDILHENDVQIANLLLAINVDASHLHILDAEIRFTLRFKCALGRRNAGITIAGYKPIHFTGRILVNNDSRFIGYGEPLVAYGLNELRLSSSMFMFRATMALRLVFVDSRVTVLTDFGAGTLLDRSLYQLIHAEDVHVLEEAHRNAIQKNQSISGYYRMLANLSGWCWVRTKLTLINGIRYPNVPLLLGVTSTVSGIEKASTACDIFQKISPSNKSLIGNTMLGEYSQIFYHQTNFDNNNNDINNIYNNNNNNNNL